MQLCCSEVHRQHLHTSLVPHHCCILRRCAGDEFHFFFYLNTHYVKLLSFTCHLHLTTVSGIIFSFCCRRCKSPLSFLFCFFLFNPVILRENFRFNRLVVERVYRWEGLFLLTVNSAFCRLVKMKVPSLFSN